jgi:hypothetical protein
LMAGQLKTCSLAPKPLSFHWCKDSITVLSVLKLCLNVSTAASPETLALIL